MGTELVEGEVVVLELGSTIRVVEEVTDEEIPVGFAVGPTDEVVDEGVAELICATT